MDCGPNRRNKAFLNFLRRSVGEASLKLLRTHPLPFIGDFFVPIKRARTDWFFCHSIL